MAGRSRAGAPLQETAETDVSARNGGRGVTKAATPARNGGRGATKAATPARNGGRGATKLNGRAAGVAEAYSAPSIHEVPADAPSRPAPPWLNAVCAWHTAGRRPAPIALDTAAAAGVTLAITGSWGATAAAAVSFLAGGLLFGLWQRRGSLETQGVAWYVRRLLPTAVAAAFAVDAYLYKPGATDNRAVVVLLSLLVSHTGIRAALWQVISRARRRHLGLKAAMVVGPAKAVAKLRHRMYVFPEAGLRFVVGCIPRASHPSENLGRLADKEGIEHVVLIGDNFDAELLSDFVAFTDTTVEMSVLLPLARLAGINGAHIGDLGLIPMRMRPSWGSLAVKRVIDVVASACLVVLASPLLAAIAIAIRRDTPGPAIFKQQRVGLGGKPFTVYKFRSMVVGAEHMPPPHIAREEHAQLLEAIGADPSCTPWAEIVHRTPIESMSHLTNAVRDGDPRVTRVGALLRKTAFDELPQLFNVLKGDMSLVGPRPLALSPEQFDVVAHIRHRVHPGLTGPWQVHGSSALPYRDMVDLDLTYVATRSLGTDVKLLARTLPALLARRSPA
jgi:lipopolysaccharide/colanic/teichoic acid biosynthesis glycosyltransferase